MMKYKKIIKIKNPSPKNRKVVGEILDNSSFWEYLSEGGNGVVYYFVVKNRFKFKGIVLSPGEYVLKCEQIYNMDILQELSDLKLIPKIYYIDKSMMIMKYIPGKPLSEIKGRNTKKLLKTIVTEYKKWIRNKEAHGDIHENNILVDKNLNVYFIDPLPSKYTKDNYEDLIGLYDLSEYLEQPFSEEELSKLSFKK